MSLKKLILIFGFAEQCLETCFNYLSSLNFHPATRIIYNNFVWIDERLFFFGTTAILTLKQNLTIVFQFQITYLWIPQAQYIWGVPSTKFNYQLDRYSLGMRYTISQFEQNRLSFFELVIIRKINLWTKNNYTPKKKKTSFTSTSRSSGAWIWLLNRSRQINIPIIIPIVV